MKKPYALKSEALNQAVQKLIEQAGGGQESDLLAQMVTTVLKLQDEQVDRGDLKILNTTLKELRWAFRLYRPYRFTRKVCIFGSARTKKPQPAYQAAKEFGRLMADSNWMVVTGGAGGVMGAGNEGAGRDHSFGANIILPFEQSPNPVVAGDRKLINFRYFFTRKLIFVKESDAICLFPGGFGTLDEGFEVLTLVQTGKMMPRPIVMVEPKGGSYWRSWLRFVMKSILGGKMIDRADLNLFQIVKTPEEAHDLIVNFYENYHSMRFVGEDLVIRIKKKLGSKRLEQINRSFKDILVKGEIKPSTALMSEFNEPDIAHLHRLVLQFNRRSYGRLRQLVDVINRIG
ncbi:MAG: TIGR00730 family Rossman fold protein [Candidatus Omnitrophica bacterium]|nr:TIGR00730 family Rossman fold protein [Candidatus Omnitrophota bacterium]